MQQILMLLVPIDIKRNIPAVKSRYIIYIMFFNILISFWIVWLGLTTKFQKKSKQINLKFHLFSHIFHKKTFPTLENRPPLQNNLQNSGVASEA